MEISNLESAQEKKFLEVKIKEGEGTNENPVRVVTYLCEKTGEILLRRDPHESKMLFAKEDIQKEYKKDMSIRDAVQDAVKHLGWERANKNEKVIKALMNVGIDPKKCFFDQDDNLIIPISEIQKRGKNDKSKRRKGGEMTDKEYFENQIKGLLMIIEE